MSLRSTLSGAASMLGDLVVLQGRMRPNSHEWTFRRKASPRTSIKSAGSFSQTPRLCTPCCTHGHFRGRYEFTYGAFWARIRFRISPPTPCNIAAGSVRYAETLNGPVAKGRHVDPSRVVFAQDVIRDLRGVIPRGSSPRRDCEGCVSVLADFRKPNSEFRDEIGVQEAHVHVRGFGTLGQLFYARFPPFILNQDYLFFWDSREPNGKITRQPAI
eukprot:gene91-biopygen168